MSQALNRTVRATVIGWIAAIGLSTVSQADDADPAGAKLFIAHAYRVRNNDKAYMKLFTPALHGLIVRDRNASPGDAPNLELGRRRQLLQLELATLGRAHLP